MMSFDSHIRLDQLIIRSKATEAYNEKFHDGINIIRGENGSGKSTIMDFIFHVLGGDVKEWKDAAKKCDLVTAQVTINQHPIVIRRPTQQEEKGKVKVFYGTLNESSNAPFDLWLEYPIKRSVSKESFSQAMFSALNYPEIPAVDGDDINNITMHQLLRLIYVDQMSPVEQIFKFEPLFDKRILRETVGNFLCGAYDPQLYTYHLELKKAEKELLEVETKWQSYISVLGNLKHSLTEEWVNAEISKLQQHKSNLLDKLSSIKLERLDKSKLSEKNREELASELKEISTKIIEVQDQLRAIELEILDSQAFIEHLQYNFKSLTFSEATVNAFSNAHFVLCPLCFNKLDTPNSEEDTCSLCKSTIGSNNLHPNFHKIKRDLELQLKESNSLQSERKKTQATLSSELDLLIKKKSELYSLFQASARAITSKEEEKVAYINREIGAIDNEVKELREKAKIFKILNELSLAKAKLKVTISTLQDSIDTCNRAIVHIRQTSYDSISQCTLSLLKRDLPREISFIEALNVIFSFAENKIQVNGLSFFSASSMVYLKNSFHLALFLASLEKNSFRYPKFVLFDNVEDKGMELERSHNFQRIAVSESEKNSDVSHQVIMTTSMIAPELDVEPYVIGESYTHEKRSLKIPL